MGIDRMKKWNWKHAGHPGEARFPVGPKGEEVDEDDLGSVFARVRGSVLARVSPGVGSGGLEVGGFSEASLGVDDGEEDLRKCWERWWVV